MLTMIAVTIAISTAQIMIVPMLFDIHVNIHSTPYYYVHCEGQNCDAVETIGDLNRILFDFDLFGQLIGFLIRSEEHVQHEGDQQDRDDQTENIQVAGEGAADLVDAQRDHIRESRTDTRSRTPSTCRSSSHA